MNRPHRFFSYAVLSVIATLLIAPLSSHSETMEEAWNTALIADHLLRATRRSTESAGQSLDAAKAARLPRLDMEGGITLLDDEPAMVVRSNDLPMAVIGSKVPVEEDRSLSCGVTVNLPIYTSKFVSHGIDAAESSLEAARTDEDRAVQDLKMKVAEAYIAVLRAKSGVAVAENHVESLSAHAWDVENLHKEGFVPANDLMAAQVTLADAKQRALQARNRLDITRASYNRLLGRPLIRKVELDELLIEVPSDDLTSLTDRALQQRHELKSLTQQVKVLRHQAAMERAVHGPQVGVSGGYSFKENRYQDHEGVWSAHLGLTWNLFDGGIAQHQSRAIESKAEALLEQYADLESGVALETREAWLAVRESRERTEVTQKALSQAEENLKVTKDRYREGLSTNTEVLDAETLRATSHSNYDNALYDAALAKLRLRRACGDL